MNYRWGSAPRLISRVSLPGHKQPPHFGDSGLKAPGIHGVMEMDGDAPSENEVERSLVYLGQLAKRHQLPDIVSTHLGPEKKTGLQERVAALFQDRVKAEKSIVRQLLNEIVIRDDIRKDAVQHMDEEICQCGNWLNEIQAIREHSYIPDPEDSLWFGSRRTALEEKILGLESEKRAEESSAWRDLSTLRRYLLFALRDYWAAARRGELLRWGQDVGDETVSERD